MSEDRVVDLMAALEQSVQAARVARKAREHVERALCPDVSGADVGQRRRRGVLTVSADLDREHLLAELKGAVKEIGDLMDDVDELHAEIACLEEEIEMIRLEHEGRGK